MAERANLRDVAERAEVSVRTVSNVVNSPEIVSAATRDRVLAAIAELGYRPNFAARALRRGHTVTISLVVPEIDSPYFSQIAALLVRSAAARGWSVDIEQTDGDPQRERALLEGAGGRGVDGIILSPWGLSADEVSRSAVAPPVVLLGEQPGLGVVDRVAIDNEAAGREATAHLLALGRTRIAVIGAQPHLDNQTAVQRIAGYRVALDVAGVAGDAALELPVDRLHRADGRAAMNRLLDETRGIDAVFCLSDQLAAGAVRACADRGLEVPDDIAVVGFDDIDEAAHAVPSLTTISPDKQAIVDAALQCLDERSATPDTAGREIVVPHELVIRESAPAPAR